MHSQEDHLLQLASIKVVLAEDSLKPEYQEENGIIYVNLRAGSVFYVMQKS